MRCALGALTLYAFARFRKITLPREKKALFHIWVVSLLLNVFPGIFFAVAETKVTSILAGIINAVTPLMTLIAILGVNKTERANRAQVTGLFTGFAGVLVVLGAWNGLGTNPWWAVLILFVAVALYGISYPYTRRFVMPLGIKPEAIVATQLLLATTTILPLYLATGLTQGEVTVGPLLSMAALGIFGSGFAYLWNFRVMEIAGSAISSSVTYLTPVVAVVAGIIFLGESISWHEPVGALIVLLGAAIAQERIKLNRP